MIPERLADAMDQRRDEQKERAMEKTCLRLVRADPSFRVPSTCACGRVLWPRRVVGGAEFSIKEQN